MHRSLLVFPKPVLLNYDQKALPKPDSATAQFSTSAKRRVENALEVGPGIANPVRLRKARSLVVISLAFLLTPGALMIPTRAEQVITWNPTTRYPVTASGPSCVTSSGYVYCVVGYTAASPYNPVGSVFYTRVTSSGVGAWTNTTTYPTPRGQSSCVATGGYIYCAGNGAQGRAPINGSGVGPWSSVGYPGPGAPPGCDTYEITVFEYLYC